jgi:hypothetical protein
MLCSELLVPEVHGDVYPMSLRQGCGGPTALVQFRHPKPLPCRDLFDPSGLAGGFSSE